MQSITTPYSALVTGLAGIPSEEEYETNLVVRKAAARGDSNSVFRNILLQLKSDQQKWQRFCTQIGRIFPDYALDVSFNPDSDETIRCVVQRDGITYPIDSCGTGVLQAIQIFSYINLFEPKILLLDEPDSHLHPNNQKQLAEELIEASNSGLSIVVSTHSRHLVQALWENARLVWLKDGAVQPDIEDYEVRALLEIGALNVGERLGNPRYIFLTEDENHQILEILLESNGFDLEECDIVSYSGCTNIGTAIALISHLKRSHPQARYIVHRDRDFLTAEALAVYKDKFVPLGVDVFIPEGNDLESYFARPGHVAEACGIDQQMAEQIVSEAFENRRDALVEKYINTCVENQIKAGQKPNSGQLAVACQAAMNGPAAAVVHGKILMKAIRAALQAHGIRDRIISTSAALNTDGLTGFLAPQVAPNNGV
ncbi:ATP-dependent endonuclease [Cupriavidus sp. AcVe19-6a]|uniref:ATP-dependent nuclease n=1 Tax=Cupriavidus sp. AcVe19-6a TaxID=2821358 RepID=UPI001AE8B1DC|nr:AAA family ATPase [Cupriavidus sp. AcVe19-6a]MBP0634254.1 AAA family ATPase [Cupriavidus sp. AcVe19-6a]